MKDLEERLNRTEVISDDSEVLKTDGTESNVSKIVTAFEVCEQEPLDTVAMMPTEEVVTAFARAVTLTETDVGKFTAGHLTLVLSTYSLKKNTL